MTLDKHKIEGIVQIQAGYTKIGTAPAQGNRIKSWWTHPTYPRVESIYSPDGTIAITAYHV